MAWFAESSQRFRIGHFIAGIAFLLFYFPFFAGFCEWLRGAGRHTGNLVTSRMGRRDHVAAGTTSGSFIVGTALLGDGVSSDAAAFGAAGSFYAYVVSGVLSGIVMIGAAVVILRTGVFRRWLGWAAVSIGLAAIIGSAAIVENDPAGLFASINAVAWLAYSV